MGKGSHMSPSFRTSGRTSTSGAAEEPSFAFVCCHWKESATASATRSASFFMRMAPPVVDAKYKKDIERCRRDLRALLAEKNCSPLILRLA